MGQRKIHEEEINKFVKTSKVEDLAKVVSIIHKIKEERKQGQSNLKGESINEEMLTSSELNEDGNKLSLHKSSVEVKEMINAINSKECEVKDKYKGLSMDEKTKLIRKSFEQYNRSSDDFINEKELEKMLDL